MNAWLYAFVVLVVTCVICSFAPPGRRAGGIQTAAVALLVFLVLLWAWTS